MLNPYTFEFFVLFNILLLIFDGFLPIGIREYLYKIDNYIEVFNLCAICINIILGIIILSKQQIWDRLKSKDNIKIIINALYGFIIIGFILNIIILVSVLYLFIKDIKILIEEDNFMGLFQDINPISRKSLSSSHTTSAA